MLVKKILTKCPTFGANRQIFWSKQPSLISFPTRYFRGVISSIFLFGNQPKKPLDLQI